MANRINPNLKHLCASYLSGNTGAVLEGSSRSGKTWSGVDFMLWLTSKHVTGKTINIIRETYNSFKTTLYIDFNRRLPDYGIRSPFQDVRDCSSFNLFGNRVHLIGADKPSKFHGAGADFVWFNECLYIDQAIFDQAEMRCQQFWWGDYNPEAFEHWLYDSVLPRDDVSYLKTTFLDNPFISKNERRKILSYDPGNPDNVRQGTADEFNWKVYGLGERAAREGAVFKNWKKGEFDESLPYIYGLDFGFSPDPDVMVKMAVDEKRKRCYWQQVFRYNELHTPELIGHIRKGIGDVDDLIIADCAEKRMIDEIRQDDDLFPINIKKCRKGADSVRSGIKRMMAYEHIVHPDSKDLHNEFNNYVWNSKKAGVPQKGYDHGIDAGRYAFEKLTKSEAEFS